MTDGASVHAASSRWPAWYRRFWLEHSVPRVKLALLRLSLCTVVGIDAFLQISHAPRYGAGGFNVPHLAALDAILPGPTRGGMVFVFSLQAYLAFRVAVSASVRTSLWLLTALYGYAYFVSQLDSYQHHYLLFLVLLIGCFVPWTDRGAATASATGAPADDDADDRDGGDDDDANSDNRRTADAALAVYENRTVTSWAIRLILVQISLVYLWAAIAKLSDPLWLDGSALAEQMKHVAPSDWNLPGVGALIESIRGWIVGGGASTAAKLVAAIELALAGALLWRRAWPAALIVGVGFHIGVELSGFRIGLFSYFMVALYTLIIPDGWIAWIERHARRLAAPRLRQLARALRRRRDGLVLWLTLAARPGLWLATLAALAVGTYSLTQRQFDEATAVAIGALVLSVVDIGAARLRTPGRRARILGLAAAHLVAALAIAAVDNHSETTFDYYKYWGGASRRLGDTDGAREAYTRLTTDVRPEWGSAHYHLANLARREGRADDAIAGYERAQRLSPTDYRSFLAAAELHNAAGRQAETLAAARRALQLAPNQAVRQRAQALIQRWTGR